MSIYFTLIVEYTENAILLLLKRAYPISCRLVQGLREDWLECVGLWVRHQVDYGVQYLNERGQAQDYARSDVVRG